MYKQVQYGHDIICLAVLHMQLCAQRHTCSLPVQVYWLDLDYGAVAACALQCSRCLTALLYLEHWCEERHGRLVLGDEQLLDEVWT